MLTLKKIILAILIIGITISFCVQSAYAFRSTGTLIYTVTDNVNILDAKLGIFNDDIYGGDYFILSIPAFHDDWYWMNLTYTQHSIDIRDRPYIPIDLLVNWNHPYIINYTTIHSEWGWFDNTTVTYNDLWDSVTLYGKDEDEKVVYIGKLE